MLYNADKNYEVKFTGDGCLCKSTANIAEKTSIAANTAYIQQLFEK